MQFIYSLKECTVEIQSHSLLPCGAPFGLMMSWFDGGPMPLRWWTLGSRMDFCCSWGRTDSSSLSGFTTPCMLRKRCKHQKNESWCSTWLVWGWSLQYHDLSSIIRLFHKMVSLHVWYVKNCGHRVDFLEKCPEVGLPWATRLARCLPTGRGRLSVWVVVPSWNGRWPVETYPLSRDRICFV